MINPLRALDSIIKIPIHSNSGRWYITFQIGQDKTVIEEKINQEIDYSWYKGLIESKSIQTLATEIIKYQTQSINATLYKDSLTLNTTYTSDIIELKEFYFSCANIKSLDIGYGAIGFGYIFKDKSKSIVHQLYNAGIINHLMYAIIPSKKDSHSTQAILYLGGIPLDTIHNKPKMKCKVNSQYTSWNCDLSHVLVGDISFNNKKTYYVNNHEAVFNAYQVHIIAPESFMNYLKTNVFGSYIGNKTCDYYIFALNQYFRCHRDIVSYLPKEFHFVIDSYSITIPTNELFDYDSEFCYFNIGNQWRNKDKWVFGKAFLKRFDSVFNYEEETVTLYTNDNNIHYVTLNQSTRSLLFIINSIILFIGSAMIIIIIKHLDFFLITDSTINN